MLAALEQKHAIHSSLPEKILLKYAGRIQARENANFEPALYELNRGDQVSKTPPIVTRRLVEVDLNRRPGSFSSVKDQRIKRIKSQMNPIIDYSSSGKQPALDQFTDNQVYREKKTKDNCKPSKEPRISQPPKDCILLPQRDQLVKVKGPIQVAEIEINENFQFHLVTLKQDEKSIVIPQSQTGATQLDSILKFNSRMQASQQNRIQTQDTKNISKQPSKCSCACTLF